MRIVADRMMPELENTFGRHGEISRVDGRSLSTADLANADVLLVRSISRVDQALLETTPVRFVGSATIGTDHLDTGWMSSRGIAWSNAPGCNADAAAQYTLAMMLLSCQRRWVDFRNLTTGVIGFGNVGSRLSSLLQTCGQETIACDPPLQERGHKQMVSLAQALAQPMVSLHVPLTTEGACPTLHMINAETLELIGDSGILINASRGAVTEPDALSARLQAETLTTALDVWPDEPGIDTRLIANSAVATPHVAGHSLRGKLNGTHMIYQACCNALGWNPELDTSGTAEEVTFKAATHADPFRAISEIILKLSGVHRDDVQMRELCQLPAAEVAPAFDRLRRDYPARYEFSQTRIQGLSSAGEELASGLGFRIA